MIKAHLTDVDRLSHSPGQRTVARGRGQAHNLGGLALKLEGYILRPLWFPGFQMSSIICDNAY